MVSTWVSCQGFSNRPASPQPGMKRSYCNSGISCPLCQQLSFAIKSIRLAVSSIFLLFRSSRPLNISWLIIAIIVNAINRVLFGRSKTYIIKEGIKRISPLVTYFYSATSIIFKGSSFQIITTSRHTYPGIPFFSPCHSMSSSIYSRAPNFIIQTSTTLRSLGSKRASASNVLAAAVTLAKPESISTPSRFGRRHALNCHQSPKSPTRNINMSLYHMNIIPHIFGLET